MLAVTEIGSPLLGAIGEPDALEQSQRRLAQLRFQTGIAPKTEGVPRMRLHRKHHIVEHAEIEEQRGDLERARQPQRGAAVHRHGGDVDAGESNAARVGRELAAELQDQRGLAGAVRPDYRVQLAGLDHKRDIVAGDDALEALDQMADLQQRLAHARPLLSSPMIPPRAKRTTRSSSGPKMICQYSVMPDSASSSTSSATAPTSGPNSEPMPPSTTMTMRSPERVQCIIAGLTHSV